MTDRDNERSVFPLVTREDLAESVSQCVTMDTRAHGDIWLDNLLAIGKGTCNPPISDPPVRTDDTPVDRMLIRVEPKILNHVVSLCANT